MSVFVRQNSVPITYKSGDPWTILSPVEQAIKAKIENVGTPLKEWDVRVNRGILTGLNDAFIITDEVRKKLIEDDPKSAEIIRPILRGRDIYRDRLDFHNLFLINSHNGYVSEDGDVVERIKIEEYPAVKNWLDNGSWNKMVDKISNIDRLTKRTDQGDTPYNLRSLAYMDDFNIPKILFSEMVKEPQFYLDKDNYFANDTVTFITGENMDNLVKMLNSKTIFTIYKNFYAGGGLGQKGVRVKKTFLESLPLMMNLIINSDNSTDIEEEIQQALNLTNIEKEWINKQNN